MERRKVMKENINNLNALIIECDASAEFKQKMLEELIQIEQKRRAIERMVINCQERNQ